MRFVSPVIVLLMCAFIGACNSGPRTVKITGKLNSNDQPLKIDPKGSVTVVFTPVVEKGTQFSTYTGRYASDSPTFEIVDIPEGKYKISLMCMVPQPTKETEDINQRFTAEKTPIIRNVKGGEQVIIDIAKP